MGRSGFTLVELLVSILILSIAGLALAKLSSMTTRGDRISRDEAAAMALAVQKMEEFQQTPYASLAVGSGSDATPLTAGGASDPSGIFTRSWTVASSTLTVAAGVTVAAKELTVTVAATGGATMAATTKIADPTLINTSPYGIVFPTVSETSWKQIN